MLHNSMLHRMVSPMQLLQYSAKQDWYSIVTNAYSSNWTLAHIISSKTVPASSVLLPLSYAQDWLQLLSLLRVLAVELAIACALSGP